MNTISSTPPEGGRLNIEELLKEGALVRVKPEGYSMYPMFVPGRDEALIERAEPDRLKRGDVVLYRRRQGILVLHRIWKRGKDGFYLVGDNQSRVEGPLEPEQIKGVLVRFIRKGREISTADPLYRVLSGLWLRLRPFRPVLSKTAARLKKRWRSVRQPN